MTLYPIIVPTAMLSALWRFRRTFIQNLIYQASAMCQVSWLNSGDTVIRHNSFLREKNNIESIALDL